MQEVYIAMYGDRIDLVQALFISFFAMAIVFLVLLIISYLIDAVAYLLNKNHRSKKISINAIDKNDDINIVDNANNKNTVVVIAAAIASYLETQIDNIRITKIRRITKTDSAWTERGLLSYIK